MAINIKKLNAEDLGEFIALVRVFEDVFEMKDFSIPSNDHLRNVLAKPDFIVMVAKEEERVIGGLTGYVLHQYYSEKPLAYIYDLAVQTDRQRQGVGKRLISTFVDYCKAKNYEEVFVQADKADDYAIDFYRSTGVTAEEQVVHFYYTL
jgi:aminoglycoside 3-N-acetyltransferase I